MPLIGPLQNNNDTPHRDGDSLSRVSLSKDKTDASQSSPSKLVAPDEREIAKILKSLGLPNSKQIKDILVSLRTFGLFPEIKGKNKDILKFLRPFLARTFPAASRNGKKQALAPSHLRPHVELALKAKGLLAENPKLGQKQESISILDELIAGFLEKSDAKNPISQYTKGEQNRCLREFNQKKFKTGENWLIIPLSTADIQGETRAIFRLLLDDRAASPLKSMAGDMRQNKEDGSCRLWSFRFPDGLKKGGQLHLAVDDQALLQRAEVLAAARSMAASLHLELVFTAMETEDGAGKYLPEWGLDLLAKVDELV